MEQDDRRPGRASERGVTPRKHAPAKPPAALFLPPPAAVDEPESEEPEVPKPARRTSAPAAAFRAAPVAEQLTVDLPTLPAARPPAAATAAPRFESEPEQEPPTVEEAAPVTIRRGKPSSGTEKATPTAEQTEIIEAPPARAAKKAPTKRTTSRATDEPAKTRTTKPRKTAAKPADTPPADLAPPATEPESSQLELPTTQAQPEAPAATEPPITATAPEVVEAPAQALDPEPSMAEPLADQPEPAAIAPEPTSDEPAAAAVSAEIPAAEIATAEADAASAQTEATSAELPAPEIATAEPTASAEAEPAPAALPTDQVQPAAPPADQVQAELADEPPPTAPETETDEAPTAADDVEAKAEGVTVGRDDGAIRDVLLPRTRGEVVSPADLWAAVKEQPRRAPAALALAAVAHHADTARRQAEWLRHTYPHVDPDRLARVSIATAGRRARVAALASTLPLGGVAGLSAQLWAHARMVLEIAALYGFDPAEPDRAAEMLALLGVYPEVGAATAAVHAIRGEATTDRAMPAPRVGVATAAFVRQAADRLVPGSALVMAALGGAIDVDDLAARTVRFYRARRA